jgi:hypothetical protein
MLISLTLLAALAAAGPPNQNSVDREIPNPCNLVLERARQYFSRYGFWVGDFPTTRPRLGEARADMALYLANGKQPLITPSGQRIRLNRFGVRRYLEKGQLSPFRIYTGFQLYGWLELTSRSSEACHAALRFEVGAYEWSPVLIVDGWGLALQSNRMLETQYLDAIFDQPNRQN